MRAIILVSLLVVGISAVPLVQQTLPKVKYDNYKVYRFVPQTEEEVQLLSSLEETYPGVNFLTFK